jgi:secreted PhoX family phosphatase
MSIDRRQFLKRGAAAGAAWLVPGAFDLALARIAHGAVARAPGFGPLMPDPEGLLDLPAGFAYRALSASSLGGTDPRFAATLDDGTPVPPLHDGMAAFAGPDGVMILVRNHELNPGHTPEVDPGRTRRYDPLGTGGTTTLWVDAERKVVRAFASLSGTFRNCAGGATPWGTWLTCEECTYMPGDVDGENHDRRPDVERPHGYVFEVDARATGLVPPVPIRGMGRFYHEAVAVDPATGTVYLTEDRDDGLIYRFTPDVVTRGRRKPGSLRPGDLAAGGVLEALRVTSHRALRTQNWGKSQPVRVGERFEIDWVRIEDPEPAMDQKVVRQAPLPARWTGDPRGRRHVETARGSTRGQGFALGAAQFARAEGMAYHDRAIYTCCTNGGREKLGQVWRIDLVRGELSLVIEADTREQMEGPDNLSPAPFGDLVICEDGRDADRVLGLTPEGRLYEIARNALGHGELAGACFSPDASTLFVNMQEPGITFAIWGPWSRRLAG